MDALCITRGQSNLT